jgi:hypothetical protein
MKLPCPRGPLSEHLFTVLHGDAHRSADLPDEIAGAEDVIGDEDIQMSLYVCYQLHFDGFDDVDDGWEWRPDLLAFRGQAEQQLEAALQAMVDIPPLASASSVPELLGRLIDGRDGPSMSKFIQHQATLDQFRELLIHRSLYHLHEADPHTFVIPRLTGRPKAALIEIQIDEYGGGQLTRMHAQLFRDTMNSLGLDSSAGAYLDEVPAITLATNNVLAMFGLHRRLRAAMLGQLAVFEMDSSLPNRRYGSGLRRLGDFGPDATRFFDEHVEADAVHEQIAAHDLCAAFCEAQPDQTRTLLFGAAAWLAIETRLNAYLMDLWESEMTTLRGRQNYLAVAAQR